MEGEASLHCASSVPEDVANDIDVPVENSSLKAGESSAVDAKAASLNKLKQATAESQQIQAEEADAVIAEGMRAMSLSIDDFKRPYSVYKMLTMDYPTTVGKAVSKKEREEKSMRTSTLVYGEINFQPFALALAKIKHKYNGLACPGGLFL